MNTVAPPPFVPKSESGHGQKLVLIGVLTLALMIGAFLVGVLSSSREETAEYADSDMIQGWGSNVMIDGPMAMKSVDSTYFIVPDKFVCSADLRVTEFKRGIYKKEMYDGTVSISGCFSRSLLTALGERPVITLNIDPQRIVRMKSVNVAGIERKWQRGEECIYVALDSVSSLPETVEFSTSIFVRGSDRFAIREIGEESEVSIKGNTEAISFAGKSLPTGRNLSDGGFQAKWEGTFSGNAPMEASEEEISCHPYAEVQFLAGVSRYQKVERTLKYSILLILLTFVCIWLIEIFCKKSIPLLNYFLIGAALVVFYSLLLAMCELISFGYSYMIAAIMTAGLISMYMWKITNSRNIAGVMALTLSVLYGICYLITCREKYTLLLGSLLLFAFVGAMMYGSLKLKKRNKVKTY